MDNKTNSTEEKLTEGLKVDGRVNSFSPMGANIRFNDNLEGLLYQQEVYPTLRVGDQLTFYIKKIREDGKVDLTLDQSGYKNFIKDSTDSIILELRKYGGYLPFNDKSDPDQIREKFHMSKKKFKETIGHLYKSKQIIIEDNGIRIA